MSCYGCQSLAQRIELNEATIADLQGQVDAANERADKAVSDRRDVLDVKTKEGMSCSEWVMRIAKKVFAIKKV